MKVLIVSDTHGYDQNFEAIMDQEAPVDVLIHCGDIEGSEDYFEALAECPVYMVRGNNDFFSDLPSEMVFELGGRRIFLSHGHCYGVSMGIEHILDEGMDRGADLIIFGHTHRPLLMQEGDTTVLNPGSLSFPRQEGRKPTYMVVNIDEKNNFDFLKKIVDI